MNETQPDRRQDGDGLQQACDIITAYFYCHGINEARAAGLNIVARIMEAGLTVVPLPTRDVAEGAGEAQRQLERLHAYVLHNYTSATTGHDRAKFERDLSSIIRGLRAQIAATPKPAPNALRAANTASRSRCKQPEDCVWPACGTPPQGDCGGPPAPDAMREALEAARDFLQEEIPRIGREVIARANIALSAPPAAEPITTWQWRHRDAHRNAPWSDWRHVDYRVDEFRELWKNQMVGDPAKAAVELRPLYATPPVRGDREAIARMLKDRGFTSLDGLYMLGRKYALDVIDAILSLLVQSGAGERGATKALINALDLGIHWAQEGGRSGVGLTKIAACNAVKIITDAKTALSRQAPQSSREG